MEQPWMAGESRGIASASLGRRRPTVAFAGHDELCWQWRYCGTEAGGRSGRSGPMVIGGGKGGSIKSGPPKSG
jgi:hypothetical protein